MQADTAKLSLDNSSHNFPEIFLLKPKTNPLNLKEVGLEYWQIIPEYKLTENQLFQLSIRLRDIARYLGSNWPVKITITNQQTRYIQYRITNFRESGKDWNDLTSGINLNLVTQELQKQKTLEEELIIDLLLKDEKNSSSHLITNIPLSRYCYELFKAILPNQSLFFIKII
ncbi:hypothetical protein [Microcoleus sp. PH2017_05_CCC_O_A]|uniref:hypothetical protein n=1 Tax=Microcoleus sp. PH2017_05_CCC_O_A TaxID=2798816 RepID=UPI001DAE16FF|nr:hypothetical protein [Microcoleus sp. PH2017_05_CCC_O_A]MCC3436921.1 hypothetical protein [Microcoleus sp. PH2017_05_CCC_O_A]